MRLTVQNLTVTLSGRTVLSGVNVLAEPGEIVGLLGPNGSGKSTLLRVVYRHLRPTVGRVLLDGDDLLRLSPRQTARLVAALPQERGDGVELTAWEVVAMGRAPYQRAFDAESDTDRQLVRTALSRVGMAGQASRRFSTLSGGERQRVLLARAFAQQPEVLVLDEPTNHLDLRHQIDLLALLREHRCTTLVALHDLNAAAAICDRVHVLSHGSVVASGAPRAVLSADLLAEVFGVRAQLMEHPFTGDVLIAFDHRQSIGRPRGDNSRVDM